MISSILHFCAQHPFLLLPCSIFAMLLIFYLGRKKFPIASKLAIVLPIWGVINLIYGGEWNAEYVYNHGLKGTGVVISIEPTNNRINDVEVVNYHCLIKTKDGTTIKAYFENSGTVFYPQNSLELLPQIGEQFSVKYMANNAENFIILTNDSKSGFSNKMECTQLLQEIASAQAAYNFDPSDKEKAKAFRSMLNQFLKGPCDENIKTAYRLVLEQMKL